MQIKKLEDQLSEVKKHEAAFSSLQSELQSTQNLLQRTKEQLKASKEKSEKLESQLDEYDRSVPDLKTRLKNTEERNLELESLLAKAKADAERAVGRRNAAQQKADSLAKDLARLLKATPGGLEEVEATIKENSILKATLAELRDKYNQVRTAYEIQMAAVKAHSTKSLMGTSLAPIAGPKVTEHLEQLANTLTQELKQKDEILESQKSDIERLTLRVHELQKRLRDRGGSVSGE